MNAIQQEALNLAVDYDTIKLNQSPFSSRIGCINKMEHLYRIFKSHFQETQGISKNELERAMGALRVTDINAFETFLFEYNGIDKSLNELNGGGSWVYKEGEEYLDFLNQMHKYHKDTDPKFREIIHNFYISRGNESIRSTRLGINNYIKEEIKHITVSTSSNLSNKSNISSANGVFQKTPCEFCINRGGNKRNKNVNHSAENCWFNPESPSYRQKNSTNSRKEKNGAAAVYCKICGLNNHATAECRATEKQKSKFQRKNGKSNQNDAVVKMAKQLSKIQKELKKVKRKNSNLEESSAEKKTKK